MAITRRSLLHGSGLLSLWPFSKLKLSAATERPANLYQELGVRPVINCRGTHTVLGASKQWPELHAAMAEASHQFVILDELQQKIGERLSRLIGCEDAMVTTGAAGAITLGTCASIAGSDPAKIRQLPDVTGMKSEVIIQKVHRNGYDHAVRNTGARIIEVQNREQFANAISDRTAMMYFLGGSSGDYAYETPVSLEESLALARKGGFPVLVDAANMLPPWDKIRKLAALKTDLIASSGGKHMRGPQCSGILAGRKDLIQAALLNTNPHADTVGRPLKVGREEMIGVWLAAEKYSKLDFAALDRQCHEQAEYLFRELERLPGVKVEYAPHDRTRHVQRVIARWDEQASGLSFDACERQLLDGEPRIAVLREKQGLNFTFFMGDPGDEKLVARRMKEIFATARHYKTTL